MGLVRLEICALVLVLAWEVENRLWALLTYLLQVRVERLMG